MKINELKVDGFGVWSGLELGELSDQLNVFYGPNEAGKTTLMQFLRSLLYGFSSERRARYLPPVRPGRPGGALTAVAGQKTYAISRHVDSQHDNLNIVDGDHKEHEPSELAAILGNVDETIFNNVFAFGLREIQELNTLSDTQAAEQLYNLALGLDRVSLVDVMRELDASRNRILASDDRPSQVAQLLSQRERLEAEIDTLSQGTPRYLSLLGARRHLDDEIARLEQENARRDQEAREISLARVLAERWQQRAALDGQLAVAGDFGLLPEGALSRFDRLQSRLARRRKRHLKITNHRRELRGQIESLKINPAVTRNAPRLEALSEQQQWIASLEKQVAELDAEARQMEAAGAATPAQWDLAGRGAQEPLAPRAIADLRSTIKGLRRVKRRLRAAQRQMAAANEGAGNHAQKIAGVLGPSADKSFTQSLTEAGELVSRLRQRVQLDERLTQMSRREAELDEESQKHLERQVLPTWLLAGLGGLFVLGCALVLLFLAGLILPASLSGALGWPLGLIGLGAASVSVALKFAFENTAARQLDDCHQQIHQLRQQIKQAQAERDELDEQLPRGGGPLVARLQAAEKSLARLEALVPIENQREGAKRDVAAAQQQEQSLQSELQSLKKRWRQLLVEHRLPADLTPATWREYLHRREQTQASKKSLDEKRQEAGKRRTELEVLAGRVRQIAAEIGLAARPGSALEQLQLCLAELADHQLREKRRDEIEQQIAQLGQRKQRIRREADQIRRRIHRLLRLSGTDQPNEFRRRAQAQAELARLRGERARLAQEITSALANQCGEERLAEIYASHADLDSLDAQLAEARQMAAGQLNEALQKRGEMSHELKTLLEDRQLPQKRIELGMVEKRLQEAIERWRVLAVCGMMLESVRDYFEREHQPLALREASKYMARLTEGRYTRVWTPLGQHALRVDTEQGNSLSVEVLSRGTREQLFLALRLALIQMYAERGVELPLVLDDVFVNFDIGRTRAAATVLRDFARDGHQVLIFTCHEHISKLFKQLKAEVRQLPDNAHPRDQATAELAPKRNRRVREELPEPEPEVAIPEPEAEIPEVKFEVPYVPNFDDIAIEAAALSEVAAFVQPQQPYFAILPPPPAPRPVVLAPPPEPVRRPERRVRRTTQRIEWSAEEFEGELADRVRRDDIIEVA